MASSGEEAMTAQAQSLIMGIWSLSSIGMMVWNKLAVGSFPLVCTLIILQNGVTTVMLLTPYFSPKVGSLQKEKAAQWLPVVILFVVMLVSSLESLVYLPVSTVLIFRHLGNIVTSVVEFFVLGKKVNSRIVASLVVILMGILLYGSNAPTPPTPPAGEEGNSTFWGTFWVLTNCFSQVGYFVYVKWIMDRSKIDLNQYGMAFYNNLMSLPLLVMVALALGEHTRIVPTFASLSLFDWICVLASCPLAFTLSVSQFKVQSMVSATTYNVLGNMNKVLVIVFGMLCLGDRFNGSLDLAGCLIALGAGAWYSYERFTLQMKEHRSEPRTS